MSAWDARCSTCGALGAAADTESWRYVQQLGGFWWYRCCHQCAHNTRLGLSRKVLEHGGPMVEKMVDERLVILAEARAAQNGGRDLEANQRRRLH